MTMQHPEVGGSASENLDRTADTLRVAMARLRDRVAANRTAEPDADTNGTSGDHARGPADPRPAGGHVLHLVPTAQSGSAGEPGQPAATGDPPARRLDPTSVHLAQDLLVLAYRSACQSIYVCAIENEQRLRDAQDAAARIRAAANHAAEVSVRQAEDENARRLQDVQRRSEALVRVVGAQLRALGFPEPIDVPLLDVPTLAPRLPKPPEGGESHLAIAPPAFAQVPDVVHPAVAPRPREASRPERAEPARARAYPAAPAPSPRTPEPEWERPTPVETVRDVVEGAPTRTGDGEAAPLGSMELVAGPFARFSQLAAFTQALNGLPGVSSVATRQFYRGKVHFRVRYDGAVPFGVVLTTLSTFQPEVVSESPGRIELRVTMDADSEAAAPAS